MSYERAVSIQLLTGSDVAEDSQHQRLVKSSIEVCKYIMSQNLTLLAEVAKCLPVTTRQGNEAGLPSLLQDHRSNWWEASGIALLWHQVVL